MFPMTIKTQDVRLKTHLSCQSPVFHHSFSTGFVLTVSSPSKIITI
uniref:Uncharacterized protein n=1 Tax=Anguilla anguilla TaxID=7936 RepID=A0A0E9SCI9_ANGAN